LRIWVQARPDVVKVEFRSCYLEWYISDLAERRQGIRNSSDCCTIKVAKGALILLDAEN